MDEMTVRVEMSDKAFRRAWATCRKSPEGGQEAEGHPEPAHQIVLVEAGSLPRVEGKSKKVVDLRTAI
jgi:phenylacetate-CoA ligase